MKKGITGLIVVTALIALMISGCTGASSADTESNTDTGSTTPAMVSSADYQPNVDSPTITGAGGSNGEGSEAGIEGLGSRGYIDMDHSSDWSEGDVALEFDGDTYYIPVTTPQP